VGLVEKIRQMADEIFCFLMDDSSHAMRFRHRNAVKPCSEVQFSEVCGGVNAVSKEGEWSSRKPTSPSLCFFLLIDHGFLLFNLWLVTLLITVGQIKIEKS
jgi:hypothetical protein